MTIIRDAEWKECNEPHGELVLLWNNHRTLVTYYQSRRTGHVYRFLIQDQKWEYAK